MKDFLLGCILILASVELFGQASDNAREGVVSYVSTQNVYVKFSSTEGLENGDTLYVKAEGIMVPALRIREHSSFSCICTPLTQGPFRVGDKFLVTPRQTLQQGPPEATKPAGVPGPVVQPADTAAAKQSLIDKPKQAISGRVSVSSYSNFSSETDFSQRMRYNVSLNAMNIGNTGLSAESYVSFVHSPANWEQVKQDIFNGLKIYNLALNYRFNDNHAVWLGRKINPNLSNAGAIDGLQYEFRAGKLIGGIVAGTRPDFLTYGLNANLLQYGGYLGHHVVFKQGSMQNTAAFLEQQNSGKTDRRFAYFQHTSTLLRDLYLFGSLEVDLYRHVMNKADSTYSSSTKPNLTNLFLSVRYSIFRQLSVSFSYSARQNIIYYESYKDIVERLLEASRLQGYSMQVTFRPFTKLSMGINAGYRSSKDDPSATRNLYSYITYSSLPWIRTSATLSATLLETNYLSGNIYSLGLTRDLLKGKLYGGIGYRYVDYKYSYAESSLLQHMAEMNLMWRAMKKLSVSVNFEGTFEKGRNYERIYLNISQRF